ncbi:hypothetical protein DM02DRAFT_698965 [Periconia macrospinosa]|uniref:Uncharacterized protein n=1 Tax=Periconia macrospinosa TaxID=97972 RepID=A0A2V1D589_9PLEO|nr:hypothetical protein DM02DRAFT_698965 [Periconia macrospinosa]
MPRGRLKIYFTTEAKAEAKQRSNHKEYLRRKNRSLQRAARPGFIYYEPAPLNVPTIAQPDLSLRASATVSVLQSPIIQPAQSLESENIHKPRLLANHAEAAAVPSQL